MTDHQVSLSQRTTDMANVVRTAQVTSQDTNPTRNQSQDSVTSARTLSSAETRELRRVVDDIPPRLFAVAVIAFWERFTFWGLTAPWQNYMQNGPGGLVPGALGLGQETATRIYCAFYIFYYVTPIFFAILSDTRLGRFATLSVTSILYAIGCTILMVTSHPSYLKKGYALPGFIAALFMIGLGGGGFHAILTPFIADQYTETKHKLKTLKSGERVVTDRSLTLQYIYNLYYWVGNIGSLSWFATVFLEKHYNFHVAYLLTVFSIVIAMLVLFLGGKWYVKVPHEGKVLPKAVKILLCASRNGFRMTRADPAYQLEHRGKTILWSSQLVDELCRGLKACRVLIAFVTFYICFDQMQNNMISQAATMETHNIPNDVMPAMNQVACIIFGPLIQSVLYPFLQRRKIAFKPISRITVGFGFIALSMLYATIVQKLIYTTSPCYNRPRECDAAWSKAPRKSQLIQFPPSTVKIPNHINIWVQTPVYMLIAIGEIFAYVTGLEYAYDNSPKGLKAIVQAISLLMAAVGSACAIGFSPLARDPYLVTFYACLTCAMVVTTVIFWWVFRKYDEHASNEDENVILVLRTDPGQDLATVNSKSTYLSRLNRNISAKGCAEIDKDGGKGESSESAMATGTENSQVRRRRGTGTNNRESSGNLSHKASDDPREPPDGSSRKSLIHGTVMSGYLPECGTPVHFNDWFETPHPPQGIFSTPLQSPAQRKSNFEMESNDMPVLGKSFSNIEVSKFFVKGRGIMFDSSLNHLGAPPMLQPEPTMYHHSVPCRRSTFPVALQQPFYPRHTRSKSAPETKPSLLVLPSSGVWSEGV